MRESNVCFLLVLCLPLHLACDVTGAPDELGVTRFALEPELDEEELEFLRLINEYRESVGAPPLAPVDEINAAADAHSEDMGLRDYFAHEALEPAPYGVTPWERMCTFEFGPACDGSTEMGENIAAGFPDALSAFIAWQNSPGHDANMRDARFNGIGIGRVLVEQSLYRWYWTTDFSGVAPDCACADGQQRSCETADCGPGRSTCSDCEFGECVVPERGDRELCGDGFDNDCDGEIDEEDDCGPRCEPEPEICDQEDNDCDGLIDEEEICDVVCFPLDEVCDGIDNDCDLTIDEGCPCDRRPDSPLCGSEVGQCTRGTQECDFSSGVGVLTECGGAIVPSTEECDGFDNDCDGMTDEGGVCDSGDQGCNCRSSGGGSTSGGVLFFFSLVFVLIRKCTK